MCEIFQLISCVAKPRQIMGANYLFYKVNAILEIHAKIDERPFDAFSFVLFLLQYEHMMVEELLQLLISEVNAELFETVEL